MPSRRRELEQRAEVVDVRVDAAVGDEPEQVDVPAALLRARNAPAKRRVLEEVAALDRLVDPHEILVDHPARADGQVADLGVPHLPGGRPTASPEASSVVCG